MFSRSSVRGAAWGAAVLLVAAGPGGAGPAGAQPAPVPRSGPAAPPSREVRPDVSVSAVWLGGVPVGERGADLRANGGAPRASRLFETRSRLAPAPGLVIGIGFPVSPRWTIEGRVAGSRGELRTSVSGDLEGGRPVTAVTGVTELVIDGGVRLDLGARRTFHPFLSAGAGYRRQVYEGRVLVEDGAVVSAGGGIRHTLTSRGFGPWRAVGVRAEGRVQILTGGVTFDGGPQWRPSVSGGVFAGF